MSQLKGTSAEVQIKLLQLLEEEITKFKIEYHKTLKTRMTKRRSIDKKRKQLSQKVEFLLNIHLLDSKVRENLLTLQMELNNFS